MFSNTDHLQIEKRESQVSVILEQIENFKKGFPFANLQRPAIAGDGIKKLPENEIDRLVSEYDHLTENCKIIKFVPASGAASRMFQSLYNFIEAAVSLDKEKEILQSDQGFNSVYHFMKRIEEFAFYNDLKCILDKQNIPVDFSHKELECKPILEYLLHDKGLGYGKLPKGLLKFHRYNNTSRLAFEEHLVESASYGTSSGKTASVHFTVSPEHLKRFQDQVNAIQSAYEKQYGIKFDISFSVQKSSTDTIAVDMDNNPFRENGSLVFRPGGHGALIENLNDLDGDIVFIKNIDNVVPDRLKAETTKYKKAIGGLLLILQKKTFNFLDELEAEISDERFLQIAEFAKNELYINIQDDFKAFDSLRKRKHLQHYLNRPIRVCGMVKNEGEPGGGPFWVKNSKGEISLQIVESSQVNIKDSDQNNILKSATHFNPVDLVCGIKDYKGQPFDLRKYIDPETGFISIKSKDGKNLKAQELPGLWNGAMADWITLFVEVPIITFNPVKTVNDLLRPQHQP